MLLFEVVIAVIPASKLFCNFYFAVVMQSAYSLCHYSLTYKSDCHYGRKLVKTPVSCDTHLYFFYLCNKYLQHHYSNSTCGSDILLRRFRLPLRIQMDSARGIWTWAHSGPFSAPNTKKIFYYITVVIFIIVFSFKMLTIKGRLLLFSLVREAFHYTIYLSIYKMFKIRTTLF